MTIGVTTGTRAWRAGQDGEIWTAGFWPAQSQLTRRIRRPEPRVRLTPAAPAGRSPE